MPVPVPITEVVESFLTHLRGLQYSRLAIKHIRSPLNKLLHHAEKGKHIHFSLTLAEDFLRAAVKTYGKTPGSRMRKDTEHAVRILSEFADTGAFRYRKSLDRQNVLPAFMETALNKAREHAQTETGWTKKHANGQCFWIYRFLGYMDQSGMTDWNQLAAKDISGWMVSMEALSKSSRCAAFTAVQYFLKLLFRDGFLSLPIHETLLPPRRGDDRRLAHIWTDEEIDLVFSGIGRDQPEGKRDYALLLLALRLAIRASDIAKMTLDDIRWRKAELSFVQRKTGKRLALLPDDVAEALVDYLRHGRPATKRRELFLRLPAPHQPMMPVALNGILLKYRRKAGLAPEPGWGMHSLRHTMATRLMVGSVRTGEISALLGHSRLDTTRLYLRISIPVLAEAGLDPDREVAHA